MKRKSKQVKNELDFIDDFGGHHYKEYTTAQMNDLCPIRFNKCGHPHISDEYTCFGRWRKCQYYTGKNDR